MRKTALALVAVLQLAAFAGAETAHAQGEPRGGAEGSEELAKKLSNPVADLISVPFQNNYDWGLNQEHTGRQYKLNFQPVVPIHLNSEWNLISRTILPVISQHDVTLGSGSQSGIGDITQSLFLSPQKPGFGGLIWGVGPVLLLPTASDRLLGTGKWGLGPTFVVLKQQGQWTIGMLANQIWSIAGPEDRRDVSATFLQPFLSYTTRKATSFTVNSESTYDWVARQWTVPMNLTVAQVLPPKMTGLPVPIQLQLGYRHYFDAPPNGPRNGMRLSLVVLLPR